MNPKHIAKTFQLIFRYDKSIFLLHFFTLAIAIVLPFLSIYFSKYAIAYLANPVTPVLSFVLMVFLFLGAIHLLRILSSFLNSGMNKRKVVLRDKFNSLIIRKCMGTTYRYIVDKDFMEKKALAVNAYQSDKLAAVIENAFGILSSIGIIVGMAYTMKQFSYIIWVALAVILLIHIITAYYTKKADYQMDAYDTVFNVKTSYLRATANQAASAKDIRLFGMGHGIEEKMEKYSKESHRKIMEYYNSFFIRNTLTDTADFIFQSILYLYLGYRLLVEKNMMVSEYVFMVGAVTSAYTALQSLTAHIAALNGDIVYAKDFYGFLDWDTGADGSVCNLTYDGNEIKSIELRSVSFCYPDTEVYAIRNLSLTMERGKTYMVVGENGAGKSTLLKLLLRLYDTYDGEILINGIDIRKMDYNRYLEQFSVLFQDFHMLSMPISENIAPTDDPIRYGRIDDLLLATGLYDKIKTLEQGVDSPLYRMLSEDGIELSGGEMQKLAMVRALYKDSPVSIFDEPSSALDIYAEQKVLECISGLKDSHIVIYTTHRLNAKNIASEIIVMHDGSILEHGTHEALMEKKGRYFTLYETQAGQFRKGVRA